LFLGAKHLFFEDRRGGSNCARRDKFDLRREMATVVERSLRGTLAGEPAPAVIEPAAATDGPPAAIRSAACIRSRARQRWPLQQESGRKW
jgi:hypothetical protein